MADIVINEERPRGLNNPKPMPSRAARVVYRGRKPLNIGINQAKRVARRADRRDQLTVHAELGFGMPRQHSHHQQLVRSRHRYYHEQHDEFVRRQNSAA